MLTKFQRQKGIEATQRWRKRNPEKVKAANRKKRYRIYDPIANKRRRQTRLLVKGYRERINKQQNDRLTIIRKWLWVYKIKHGCIDCGYNLHHAPLHFDHVKGKKILNVCNAKSIKQAKKEISKCVIRCANCHSVITFNRLQVRK